MSESGPNNAVTSDEAAMLWSIPVSEGAHCTEPLPEAVIAAARCDPIWQMQEFEPGLWIGNYLSLCNIEEMLQRGITHALNLSQRSSILARNHLGDDRVCDIDSLTDADTSDLLEPLRKCMS